MQLTGAIHRIGSSTEGDVFATEVWNSRIVTRLEVWSDKYLWGIRVSFSDASHQLIGCGTKGQKHTLELPVGTRITSASLWGNGWGTRSGALSISYQGLDGCPHQFQVNSQNQSPQEYSQEVYSGVLAGVCGRVLPNNHDFDGICQLALKFFLNSASTSYEIKLGKPKAQSSVPKILTTFEATHLETMGFSQSVTRGRRKSLSSTNASFMHHHWDIEAKVSFGKPDKLLGAELKTGYGLDWGHSESTTSVKDESHIITSNIDWGVGRTGNQIPKGKVFHRSLILLEKKVVLPYEGTWKMILRNGASVTVTDKGDLTLTNEELTTRREPHDTIG